MRTACSKYRMPQNLADVLAAINRLEAVSSAWGTLRSRDYWPLWSTPELDEKVADEIRGLRRELHQMEEQRDALLAEDGLVWKNGAIVTPIIDEFIDDIPESILDDDWLAHHFADCR